MQPVKNGPLSYLPFSIWVLLLGLCCYWWVLDNGFMSDDLVQLDQSGHVGHLGAQLRSAPASFRLTTFGWFWGLQGLFGYRPAVFYLFSILLHCFNVVLLSRVLVLRGAQPKTAAVAALLFLVIQNPSEAIAWLSAVNELLVASFVLAVLWAAFTSRPALCLALYVGALVSKESGAVAVLLLALFAFLPDRRDRRLKLPGWFWVALGGLTVAYVAWFLSLVETNFLIQSRFYSVKASSFLVLAFSLHKLAFPWLYTALVLALVWRSSPPRRPGEEPQNGAQTTARRRELVVTAIWLVAALLPYIFLVYDTHLPSRHMYLAAVPAAYLTAQLVHAFRKPWIGWCFVVIFAVGNGGYLWFVKDAQYWARGATTRELIEILRSGPPRCVIVRDFPENPWIAKLAARFAPGWSPELINVDGLSDAPGCLVLRWDAAQNKYVVVDREGNIDE